MEIKGQVALITGAGSGLGAATLSLLAEKGAKVVGIDTNSSALDTQCNSAQALAISADVCQEHDMKQALITIKKHYGTMPRICINCAGIAPAARIVGKDNIHELELFNQVMQINVVGTFNVLRLVAEQMAQLTPMPTPDEERGIIINTASIAAFQGQIGQAAYSASKGAISALTLPAAKELSRFGIRVVAVAPGVFDTPLMNNMPAKVQSQLAEQCIFPNRFGKPIEFAEFIETLIENSMLNGQTFRIDGGYQMK